MNHFATPAFWFHYRQLPNDVRELADKAFAQLRENPGHPALRFKKVGKYWSARVGLRHRAIGKGRPEGVVWFWIGGHDEYELLIAKA